MMGAFKKADIELVFFILFFLCLFLSFMPLPIAPIMIFTMSAAILILLVPIIGAGIKTLIDYFSREYTTDEMKLDSIKQSIAEISEEQIDELSKAVLRYETPTSDSSRLLLEELSKLSKNEPDQKLSPDNFDTSKKLFVDYINDEKNNGKKAFRSIVKFFDEKSSQDNNFVAETNNFPNQQDPSF
jgi:hypothetical protein